jgi:subtilisin family serine protease/photosystem II stability/assembly factor-like uncharacterized protein
MTKHRILTCFLVLFLFACSLYGAVPKRGAGISTAGPVPRAEQMFPGVVIVKFRHGVPVTNGMTVNTLHLAGKIGSALSGNQFARVFRGIQPLTEAKVKEGKVDLSTIYFLHFENSLDPREVARQLKTAAEIEYVEPKYVNRISDIPNDPWASNQVNPFTRMNAYNGWTIAKGDSTVVIADIDGGTNWTHQDLLPNLWINPAEDINHNGRFDTTASPSGDEDGIDQDGNGFIDDVAGWNFATNSNNPHGLASTPQSAAHGTETASMFGARTNNGIGVAGSSWNCRLMPICVASPTQDGSLKYPYEGIVYAYTMGAKIINCSFGREGGISQFEQDVITAATQAGALVVAAAGNGTNNNGAPKDNDFAPTYPANYKYVLAVGATKSTSDTRSFFTNYGVTVPVFAPGTSIYAAFNTSDTDYGNAGDGTSFACPLVSGLAGIVQSLHPSWTPRQVATQIRVTADSIEYANGASVQGLLGHGRVNFARAFTESHPGIEILSSSLLNTNGKTLFLQGDTLVLSLTVQNILFADAANLTFTATTSDSSLQVLQGTATIPLLAAGNQAVVPNLQFAVGPLTSTKDIVIKLAWGSNTNDRDAFAYKVTVFASTPLWNEQTSPTQTTLFSVRAVSQNVVWAGGGNGSGTAPVVVRTTDGGTTWTLTSGNLPPINIYCLAAADENHAWVGTDAGKIYATTDGGTSWTAQSYPGTQTPFVDGIWFFDANNGYALGDPATGNTFVLLKTTNGGQTWAHLANEPVGASGEAGWNNSFWWTDVNHGWFGTNTSRIWRTTDGGASAWTSGSTGSNTDTYGVSFKDNNNGISVHSSGGIMISSNGGATWTAVASPTTNAINGVFFAAGTSYAWVADIASPYRSITNGTSWSTQSLYPFTGSIQHISFSDTLHGWAVTSSGEILAYNPLITGVKERSPGTLPRLFTLSQNYPNPFNPATTIRYDLPIASEVQLRIYDVLGRVVTTLVDGQQSPGTHVVPFDASHLASGVYFYRISASSTNGSNRQFSASRKLVLLK